MAMTEREVTKYFLEKLKEVGAEARKIKYENRRGCPDWMVVYEVLYLVELKSTKGQLDPFQKREKERFEKLNVEVLVIRSKKDVDTFIRDIQWTFWIYEDTRRCLKSG